MLSDGSNKIIQPSNLKINLMEHQKTAIYQMLKLETDGNIEVNNLLFYFNKPKNFKLNTTFGILGDMVGAGKTYMIITLITLSLKPVVRPILIDSSLNISVELKDDYINIDTNLVIVPNNLVDQWEKSFEISNLRLYIKKDNKKEEIDYTKYDVVLVGNKYIESMYDDLQRIKYGRIIIDEADTIKIAKHIDFNANFIWFVTGTPFAFRNMNKSSIITKMIGNIKGWIYDYIIIKNDDDFIKKSLALPPINKIKIECTTPAEINILHEYIPKHIVSMINAGNINQAIQTLNCNEDTTDNILQVVTKNINLAIKNKTIELETEKKKNYKGDALIEHNKRIHKINNIINRLNERLVAIKNNIMEMSEETCPICMDDFTKPTIVSCCQKIFCFQCLILSIEKTNKCPNCMKKVMKKNMNIINDKINTNIIKNNKLSKLDNLFNIIKNKPNGRFLLFSNHDQTFELINNKLKELNIICNNLKSSSAQIINETVDDFKNNKINVLLLNAQSYGTGLNLQNATDVILYHRFTREIEEQVIGRAQRIGRESQLNVYYLLHDNENKQIDDINNDIDNNINFMNYLEE
jgi:SNF2 family DNA or RNA helicase